MVFSRDVNELWSSDVTLEFSNNTVAACMWQREVNNPVTQFGRNWMLIGWNVTLVPRFTTPLQQFLYDVILIILMDSSWRRANDVPTITHDISWRWDNDIIGSYLICWKYQVGNGYFWVWSSTLVNTLSSHRHDNSEFQTIVAKFVYILFYFKVEFVK